MRYHYEKPKMYKVEYGEIYHCDHSVYNTCTLFKIGDKGLSIIQQRFDPEYKTTWWSYIDPWLNNDIYLHKHFKDMFDRKSDFPKNNIYPTISIRQAMWFLKMKPLPREPWETYFDRPLV